MVGGKIERPFHHLNFWDIPFIRNYQHQHISPSPPGRPSTRLRPLLNSIQWSLQIIPASKLGKPSPVPQPPKEDTGEAASKAVISGQTDYEISDSSSLSCGPVSEKIVEKATVPFVSKEAVFFPAEEYGTGYPKLFAACDQINNAEQAAAWKDVLFGLRAFKPFFRNQTLDSQATYEGNVEGNKAGRTRSWLQLGG